MSDSRWYREQTWRGLEGIPESQGTKHDQDKLPLELLPIEPIEEIAEVLKFGAVKYEAWNWTKGFLWMRLYGATLRHLFAWARGEDNDPESGKSHLAHAGCMLLFLLWHTRHRPDLDNRPSSQKRSLDDASGEVESDSSRKG